MICHKITPIRIIENSGISQVSQTYKSSLPQRIDTFTTLETIHNHRTS